MGTCGYKPQGTQKIMVCTRPPPVHGNYILQETSTEQFHGLTAQRAAGSVSCINGASPICFDGRASQFDITPAGAVTIPF